MAIKQRAAGVCVLFCSMALGVTGATAQTGPAARRTALRAVTKACAADYARHCPAPPSGEVSARSEAICLKFVKQDLSLACRRAVVSATQ